VQACLPCTHTTTRCLRGGGRADLAAHGRGRPSAGGGRAHRTGRSRGALDAHQLCSFRGGAQLPVGAVIVGGQTMFMPPPTKKASHEWSARRWCPRRSGSDGRTRGPAYPEIDIGASQTDSALMRGTVAGEGSARPRRCRCPRVKRIATLCSVFV
jgi:hypothetical protein